MKRALLLAKRECWAAFDSPVAYLVLAALPVLTATFFFLLGNFFAEGSADMRAFFALLPVVFVLIAPAITMRMWSEERRSGTEELLFSYPFRVRELVLGKFLGAWALLALALVATAWTPLTVAWLGDVDPGPMVGGYFGALLLGAACLSAGLFLSALTQNQIVAWLLGVLLLAILNLPALLAPMLAVSPGWSQLLLAFDMNERFSAMSRGVVSFGDLSYFVGLTVMFLCLNGLVLERRRWR
ncbi:MAG: ABC transporter permease subunit [Planctomycetes bacterium]|nr:ABC transporter permease subunit [Planctomycetota bacterium]NQU48840.1 ABC transporter permease subunit [Planctomycetota bacterium]